MALLLPVILAACSSEEDFSAFAPLHYDYLPPISLNVAAIEIRQQFFPSGARPDVTSQDPAPPVTALKTMAQDRLKAFGTSGRAVFAIIDASLTQRGDTIDGSMLVSLTIVADDGHPLGVARAQVNRHDSGSSGGLRRTLYEFTKAMMDTMNIEFEYQVRNTLKAFLIEPAAPEAPVQQAPLDGRQVPMGDTSASPDGSPASPQPASPGAPTPLQPTPLSPPGGTLPADPFAVPPADPYADPYAAPR
jgi:hypothetical protein